MTLVLPDGSRFLENSRSRKFPWISRESSDTKRFPRRTTPWRSRGVVRHEEVSQTVERDVSGEAETVGAGLPIAFGAVTLVTQGPVDDDLPQNDVHQWRGQRVSQPKDPIGAGVAEPELARVRNGDAGERPVDLARRDLPATQNVEREAECPDRDGAERQRQLIDIDLHLRVPIEVSRDP